MKKKESKRARIKREEGELLNDVQIFNEDNNPVAQTELFNPDELFSDNGGGDGSSVAKELFNPKNPKIRSEFTERQVKIIARLYEKSRKYYEPRGIYMLKGVLDEFVLLQMSKDRGSRKEFVETHRDMQKNKGLGIMDSILGRGGGLQ